MGNRIVRFLTGALLGLGVMTLQACTLGTRYVPLTYPPNSQKSDLIDAKHKKRGPVRIGPFTDKRLKYAVGHVRNAFGIKMFDAVPVGQVVSFVRSALVNEVRKAGYQVADDTEYAPDGTVGIAGGYLISGEVIEAYCDTYFTYDAEVMIMIKVQDSRNRDVLSKLYSGKGSDGLVWTGSEEAFGNSLSIALQSALIQFIKDMKAVAP